MSEDFGSQVIWDGEALIGWTVVGGVPTKLRFTRALIHSCLPGYNDAVEWEIERHRVEIFQQLSARYLTFAEPEAASASGL